MNDTENNTDQAAVPTTRKGKRVGWAVVLTLAAVLVVWGAWAWHQRGREQERLNCYYPAPGQKTEVFEVVVVDMSASMLPVRSQMVDVLNSLVGGLKAVAGDYADSQEHYLTLSGVNTEVFSDIHFNTPLSLADSITTEQFIPWNNTPLVDAIGLTIDWMKRYTDSVQDYAVMLTIVTDGFENSSENYSIREVGEMIRQLDADPHWEVTLLSTDKDVAEQGRKLHISHTRLIPLYPETGRAWIEGTQRQLRHLCDNALARKKEMPTQPACKHITLEQLRERKALALAQQCVGYLEQELTEHPNTYNGHISMEEHSVVIAMQCSQRTFDKLKSADEEQRQVLSTFLLKSAQTNSVLLLRSMRVARMDYRLRATCSETGEMLEIMVPYDKL